MQSLKNKKGENMENSDIKVSICCLTYNHERYVRKALDSFLMQKTNFKYEILIHDDASTDGTADIIREYEEKYPDIIKPIYQTENQYKQRVKINWQHQFPRTKGKYIALCEGDDYWCDSNKLQLQYDTLEHSRAVFCAHCVRLVTESGEKMGKYIPNIIEEHYQSGEKFLRDLLTRKPYPFQTSSYMFRKQTIIKECKAIPDFIKCAPVGDVFFMMLMATKGDICYIDREMSCYRQFSTSSWSVSYASKRQNRIIHEERFYRAMELFNEYTNYAYNSLVQERLNKIRFMLLEFEGQYQELIKPPYLNYFKQLSVMERIYIMCGIKIPYLIKIYRKIKNKLLEC